jgi:DNA-binding beta-propeller fold protein YncE
MRSTIIRAGTLAAALCGLGLAQNVDFQVPTAGYVYDPASSALHPVSGIPGASTLGTPLLSGLQSAAYSASADLAIVTKPEGAFLVTGVRSGEPESHLIAPGSGSPLVAWTGPGAIVYFAGSFTRLAPSRARRQVSYGSPEMMGLNVPLPPGTVTALDFDETAGRLLIALAGDDQNAGVYAWSLREGRLERLLSLAAPASITHAGSQLFILDSASSTILTMTPDGTVSPFPAPSGPSSRVVAIAASARGDRIYAADAGLSRVAVYGLNGALVAGLPVGTVPAKLERVPGTALVLLSGESGEAFWFLNDLAVPAVFFVPALAANTSASGDLLK